MQENLWNDRNTILIFALIGFIGGDITILPKNIRYDTTVFRKNEPWIIRFFCELVGRTKTQTPHGYALFRYVSNFV